MRIRYTVIDDNSISRDGHRTLTLRWREYYETERGTEMYKHTITNRRGHRDVHLMAFIFSHMLDLELRIAWKKKRGNLTVTRFVSEE